MNGWMRVFRYRLGIVSEAPVFSDQYQSVFRAFSSMLTQSLEGGPTLVTTPARRRAPRRRVANKRKASKTCSQS